MKRKELYNFVRESIISELSPAEIKANQLTIQLNKQKLADANKQLAITKDPLEKAQIAATIAVNKEKLAASIVDASTKTSTNESDLEEDRKGDNFKVGPNFANINAEKLILGGRGNNLLLTSPYDSLKTNLDPSSQVSGGIGYGLKFPDRSYASTARSAGADAMQALHD